MNKSLISFQTTARRFLNSDETIPIVNNNTLRADACGRREEAFCVQSKTTNSLISRTLVWVLFSVMSEKFVKNALWFESWKHQLQTMKAAREQIKLTSAVVCNCRLFFVSLNAFTHLLENPAQSRETMLGEGELQIALVSLRKTKSSQYKNIFGKIIFLSNHSTTMTSVTRSSTSSIRFPRNSPIIKRNQRKEESLRYVLLKNNFIKLRPQRPHPSALILWYSSECSLPKRRRKLLLNLHWCKTSFLTTASKCLWFENFVEQLRFCCWLLYFIHK